MAPRTDLEQLVYQMSVDLRLLERQNKRAIGNVDSTANRIEARYRRIGKVDVGKFLDTTFDRSRLAAFELGAARVPVFGQALEALGPAGLVAAAGIGAAALAATQAIEAMRFADEIDDAATKLNIGTEALQEFRFAVTETGGELKDFDDAFTGFQKKLGEAIAGGRALKWFERLGFSQADLKAFASTEDALQSVIGRVSLLGREAERAAVAEKLGLGPISALARGGTESLEELRQKARDLGFVMSSDLVAKGAEANQKFETMASVIKVQMTSAFVDLSDEVVDFVTVVADALKALNAFLERFEEGRRIAAAAYGQANVDDMTSGDVWRQARGLYGAAANVVRGRTGGVMANVARGQSIAGPTPTQEEMDALARPPRRAPRGELEDVSPRGSGRSSRASGPSPEELARRTEEMERTIAIEVARLAGNERLVQVLEREADIARRTQQYEALKLSATQARVKAEADQVALDEAREQSRDESFRLSQRELGIELERQRGNYEAAQTLSDRRDLEREIKELIAAGWDELTATNTAELNLLDTQRLRAEVQARIVANAALEHQLTLARIRGDERAIEQLERTLEIQRRARQREGEGNLNYGAGIGDATNEVDEEIAAASRRGFRDGVRGLLDDLQDGQLEGLLGGIFDRVSDRLKDNLADLITDLLMSRGGGGSGPAGGDWLAMAGQFLKGRIPGFRSGTSAAPGGLAYVHEGEVLTNLRRGTRVIPDHAVRAMGALQGGGVAANLSAIGRGGGVQSRSGATVLMRMAIDLAGANGDKQIEAIAYRAASEGAQAAYLRARQDIPAEMAHARKYSPR